MQISTADKTLFLKVVYYGPGLSGKTTNLETIHRLTDPDGKQPLVSLRTEGDRTLFFDLLPFDLGQLFGMDVRLKLYTVPGQVQYDITRRQVLAGADGIVFVADSQSAQLDANLQMIKYLKSNLRMNGLDPNTIPLVFQWNKRDLSDVLGVDELQRELNFRPNDAPMVPATAPSGEGVIETLQMITSRTVAAVVKSHPNPAFANAGSGVEQKVEALFAGMIKRAKLVPNVGARPTAHLTAPLNASRTHAARDRSGKDVLELDDLLFEAVQASLDMSEKLSQTASGEDAVARMRRERKALLRLTQVGTLAPDRQGVLRMALAAALSGLDAKLGSVLGWAGAGQPLHEVAASGFDKDPLNSIVTPAIGSVATTLLERAQALYCSDIRGELLFGADHPAVQGLRGVLAVPIRSQREAETLMLLYVAANQRDWDGDDIEWVTLCANVAGLSLRAITVAASR